MTKIIKGKMPKFQVIPMRRTKKDIATAKLMADLINLLYNPKIYKWAKKVSKRLK